MNYKSERELQQHLHSLEIEINSQYMPNSETEKKIDVDNSSFAGINNVANITGKITQWFTNLTRVSQIGVLVLSLVISVAVIQAIFKLLAAAISLTVFLTLIYLGYKFFVSK
ncbi:hypothetical protein RINTHM_5750 [Richelia intracellularis HM01]|uniref:hypothetical protein n=1 Tax=Richelia intracellularis TaxID=1164990 RepID=UPI0002B545C9|nr:hypothetical protein [Richelia intracellularis]CCH65041.1 hypothetical protein RINTHM_5750 [Richelia intracellularis HM01]